MKILILIITFLFVITNLKSEYLEINIPTRVTIPSKKLLAADLYSIDTNVAKPVILIQTPYNKNLYRYGLSSSMASGGNLFKDSINYNFVVVDWRGFKANTEAAIPLYDRGLDGYDIIEWIAAQKWCNGKIGTYGGSALGQIQFQTAKYNPPHLVCAVPMIKDYKTKYSDYYYGGVFRKEYVESMERLGFIEVDSILSHPSFDLLWQFVEKNNDYADSIKIPMLMISGWFDHYPSDVIRAFHDLKSRSGLNVRNQHKLILGPWLHSEVGQLKQGIWEFPNAENIPTEAAMKFFDYYLLGAKNGWPIEPVIKYYMMGKNEWLTAKDWNDIPRKLDTLYFRAEGVLSFTPPPPYMKPGKEPPDTLIYNPKNPSPSFGGARFNPFDPKLLLGPQIQNDIVMKRKDVLIYTSDILIEPLEITGNINVEIFISSDREDTDIGLRLCDVDNEGNYVLLTQGIKRLRFRESYSKEKLMVPGEIYPVTVWLEALSHTFLKGHRIGIILSGSINPMFDINLNNGKELYKPGDTLTATNFIYRGEEYLSKMILPISGKTTTVTSDLNKTNSNLNVIYINGILNLMFNLNHISDNKIKLFDINGKTLFESHLNNQIIGKNYLQISNLKLTQGIYFVLIQSGTDYKFNKFIIAE